MKQVHFLLFVNFIDMIGTSGDKGGQCNFLMQFKS